ncbi:hypothetical protein AVEN_258157-1 [Araneus ventricosus]|uniref:Uncharacterized protein n=1 Tax=Araneus ventricosus TaxID=182803 RepID=A0A4Y2KDU0_ARAVE|nr:hypothetical protein AVEN_258157-1 [Araneus ventricosus]
MMDELLVIGRGEMPRKGGVASFTPPNVERELIQKTASFRAFVSTKVGLGRGGQKHLPWRTQRRRVSPVPQWGFVCAIIARGSQYLGFIGEIFDVGSQ